MLLVGSSEICKETSAHPGILTEIAVLTKYKLCWCHCTTNVWSKRNQYEKSPFHNT